MPLPFFAGHFGLGAGILASLVAASTAVGCSSGRSELNKTGVPGEAASAVAAQHGQNSVRDAGITPEAFAEAAETGGPLSDYFLFIRERNFAIFGAPVVDSGWTRGEWLVAVDRIIELPETAPRYSEQSSRHTVESIVTTRSWQHLDESAFSAAADDILTFYSRMRELSLIYMSQGAIDETVALGIYNLEVTRSIIQVGVRFVATFSADDTTREARRQGIAIMQLGASINVCALLYLAADATKPRREAAFEVLENDSYGDHSRDGLQLILATLDDRILANIAEYRANAVKYRNQPMFESAAAQADHYRQIRAVVAAEYQRRKPESPTIATMYEGMGPPSLDPDLLVTVVSTTGGFSVEVTPDALVKRVEITVDGEKTLQHRIESQEGVLNFEAVCFDSETAKNLSSQFRRRGYKTVRKKEPGAWFRFENAERIRQVRIREIGGRGCAAIVDGPAQVKFDDRADEFLFSFEPAR